MKRSRSNAMLAGVLLNLCLAPMRAVAIAPALALPVIVVWAVVWRFWRLYAAPAAVAAMVLLLALHGPSGETVTWLARPVIVMPVWSTSAMIGLAVPLFLVTMASQNIPGMAVLAVNGFTPPAGRLFQVTGLFTLMAAPFGGHAVNLAAITAALCAGPEAHSDPAKRYWAAATAGATYVVFGLLAGGATSLIAISPPVLIEAVAGLALLGALGSALAMGAVNQSEGREAAVVTFFGRGIRNGFLRHRWRVLGIARRRGVASPHPLESPGASPPLNPIATTSSSLDSLRLAGGLAWRTLAKSRFSASSIDRSEPPWNTFATNDPSGARISRANAAASSASWAMMQADGHRRPA